MFLCLWHPAVVGRYDHEREIDRPDPCHHVFDEILVAGNVDQSEVKRRRGILRIGQLQMRETKVDGNPAPFLLRKPVRVSAGQRAHERAFPVVDMAGCGQDVMGRRHVSVLFNACGTMRPA